MMYEFDRQDAYRFANYLGPTVKERGDNLHFKVCPYCKTQKDRDTFAIDLSSGQFKCLRSSCGVSGNMITLSKDFNFSLGADIDSYYQQDRRQHRQFKRPAKPIEPKPAAVAYLEGRGISAATTQRYQITVQKEHENVLVFPFLDHAGEMRFIKYRKTDFNRERDKNREWCEANGMLILFGIYQCNSQNKTLIITEGQIDSLSVAEAGFENAVSVPTGARGFTWFPHCYDWLKRFETLIVFGDYERGEVTLLDEMKRRFQGRVKVAQPQDYRGCKDANAILIKHGKEAVKNAVENAKEIPVQQVKELADVRNVDLFSLPKIQTGTALKNKNFSQ